MELHELSTGNVAEFDYPVKNDCTCRLELARRRALVVSVRDCHTEPVELEWCLLRPRLYRGRWLVVCWDLDKNDWRQFYSHQARQISEVGSLGDGWTVVESPPDGPGSVVLKDRFCVVVDGVTIGEYMTEGRATRLAVNFGGEVRNQPILVANLFPSAKSRSA